MSIYTSIHPLTLTVFLSLCHFAYFFTGNEHLYSVLSFTSFHFYTFTNLYSFPCLSVCIFASSFDSALSQHIQAPKQRKEQVQREETGRALEKRQIAEDQLGGEQLGEDRVGEEQAGYVDPFGGMEAHPTYFPGEGEVLSNDTNAYEGAPTDSDARNPVDDAVAGEYEDEGGATDAEYSDEGGNVVAGNVSEFQNGPTFEDAKNETEGEGKGEGNSK